MLVSPPSGDRYRVSLVRTNGQVAASWDASEPPAPTCANTAAGLVPLPVSTSDTRAYFMDAQGVIRYLAPNGFNGRVTTVPASTTSRRTTFAVSPDDRRIAVSVLDFTSGGATTRLYVEDLNGGGNHVDTYTQTGAYTLWPMGWHGVDLVLAKVPSCTQGGGPTCCGPQELHVVDPTSAVRHATVGGAGCVIVGPPSPAGAICENAAFTSASILNWTGITRRSFAIQGPASLYIAPASNGGIQGLTQVAMVSGPDTVIVNGGHTLRQFAVCGWIDDTHVLAGGDAQQQPRIGDTASGAVSPVAALGDCAGRIPGDL